MDTVMSLTLVMIFGGPVFWWVLRRTATFNSAPGANASSLVMLPGLTSAQWDLGRLVEESDGLAAAKPWFMAAAANGHPGTQRLLAVGGPYDTPGERRTTVAVTWARLRRMCPEVV